MSAFSRIAGLTSLAMIAFAGNSILNRLALAQDLIDPVSYAGIRLLSGAVMLALLLRWRGTGWGMAAQGGSWWAALALALYALAFSVAYLRLAAGTGALILFAAVQLGMLGWASLRGDRPGPLELAGFVLALAFLVALLAPGVSAPDPGAAALMVVAGLAWAVYTLLGRGSQAPLRDTTGNFLRCTPLAIVLVLPALLAGNATAWGWGYAIASGALASGLGYAIWYAALPGLGRSTAAYVQLTVPAIAALGGVVFVAEPLSARLAICAGGILGGVALAVWGADRRRA